MFGGHNPCMGYATSSPPTLGDIFRHAADLLRPRRVVDARVVIETIALAAREYDVGENVRMVVADLAWQTIRTESSAGWPRNKDQALRLIMRVARQCDAARDHAGMVVDVMA